MGLTIGHVLGEEVYSFFTGVVPSWRSKRVGLALKLRLIAAARAQGIGTMRTTNLDINVPASRLNAALGFRHVPGSVELRKIVARGGAVSPGFRDNEPEPTVRRPKGALS